VLEGSSWASRSTDLETTRLHRRRTRRNNHFFVSSPFHGSSLQCSLSQRLRIEAVSKRLGWLVGQELQITWFYEFARYLSTSSSMGNQTQLYRDPDFSDVPRSPQSPGDPEICITTRQGSLCNHVTTEPQALGHVLVTLPEDYTEHGKIKEDRSVPMFK